METKPERWCETAGTMVNGTGSKGEREAASRGERETGSCEKGREAKNTQKEVGRTTERKEGADAASCLFSQSHAS
eukprot:6209057-Pleurochrysis_carterae.AAC.1